MRIKFINQILMAVILVLGIIGGFIFLYKQINLDFFTFNREDCIKKIIQESPIDGNAYLIDFSDEEIRGISYISDFDADKILAIKRENRNAVNELNNSNILYLMNHPEWREENLRKIKDVLKIPFEDIIVKKLKTTKICPRPGLINK